MRQMLAFALFMLAVAGLPARADFAAGMAAYEAGDYAAAHAEWLPLAEAGDARAQYWMGDLYRFGHGRLIVHRTALEWYLKAARTTDDVDLYRRAIYAVGQMVRRGQGARLDIDKAACLYRNAAEHGLAKAQWALCKLLVENAGHFWVNDTKLRSSAREWCQRSADQGDDYALSFQGEIALRNPLTPNEKGYMMLLLAAEQGEPEAKRLLAEMPRTLSEAEWKLFRKGAEMAKNWRARPEALPAAIGMVDVDCLP